MISLEQVQLLESRVSKAIEIVQRMKVENAALVSEKNSLLSKLEANQKRLDELEVLVMRFKEDQGRIEDGIIAALDRLSQFEEAFESSLKDDPAPKKSASKKIHSHSADTSEKKSETQKGKEFFEIAEAEKKDTDNDDFETDLSDDFSLDQDDDDDDSSVKKQASEDDADGELDIF